MTRKDYEMIARVLREYKAAANMFGEANSQLWRITAETEIAGRLADMLAQDNPRFDRARFLKACGIASE